MSAARPVPERTTPSSAEVTSAATGAGSARTPRGAGDAMAVPSGRVIRSSIVGVCRTPPAASVANALVISSGDTPSGPRVIEHTGVSGERTPIRCATATMRAGPTRTATWAKIVFTDWAIACARVIVPLPSSAKLCTVHAPVALRHRRSGMVSEGGPFQTESSGMPASSAAASVKTLKALPAWRRESLARLNGMSGAVVAIARTAPVAGSIATSAPAGSDAAPSQVWSAAFARRSRRGSRVVRTRSPPRRAIPAPSSATRERTRVAEEGGRRDVPVPPSRPEPERLGGERPVAGGGDRPDRAQRGEDGVPPRAGRRAGGAADPAATAPAGGRRGGRPARA